MAAVGGRYPGRGGVVVVLDGERLGCRDISSSHHMTSYVFVRSVGAWEGFDIEVASVWCKRTLDQFVFVARSGKLKYTRAVAVAVAVAVGWADQGKIDRRIAAPRSSQAVRHQLACILIFSTEPSINNNTCNVDGQPSGGLAYHTGSSATGLGSAAGAETTRVYVQKQTLDKSQARVIIQVVRQSGQNSMIQEVYERYSLVFKTSPLPLHLQHPYPLNPQKSNPPPQPSPTALHIPRNKSNRPTNAECWSIDLMPCHSAVSSKASSPPPDSMMLRSARHSKAPNRKCISSYPPTLQATSPSPPPQHQKPKPRKPTVTAIPQTVVTHKNQVSAKSSAFMLPKSYWRVRKIAEGSTSRRWSLRGWIPKLPEGTWSVEESGSRVVGWGVKRGRRHEVWRFEGRRCVKKRFAATG
ncbi:uncharacterized protein MYCFIDRAFT_172911 [Pseudocercospora fijiensis CIRAD86]|uniref:Uncharacterized protein n=1 Tax=Pseudocercospora fijiensis (strain CIRAD86) TaxID=383855 RepID=M2Z1Z8_PSEFD|nr:uncharacterized protein MYCFIDRAFT_172911 [Pseudocercospora fijiensis CIRAD86]EME83840.1 hypothetical protein MYCFIDRAFT_172911 [Pseudocercospora fijiensis CIRAD86]